MSATALSSCLQCIRFLKSCCFVVIGTFSLRREYFSDVIFVFDDLVVPEDMLMLCCRVFVCDC